MMTTKHLLLLSSSRVSNTDYLEHAKSLIKDHLNEAKQPITELLFIPFAGVTMDHDNYTAMVQTALRDLNINVIGIHQCENAKTAIAAAQAIVVGGGNTFALLNKLYQQDIINEIRKKIIAGIPYIGWSAGSNIAGASIKTTNDMPIIEPPSFDALNLVNLQLNPHYTDHNPVGHNGETREQRLAEFMVLNPQSAIVAIVEGSALKLIDDKLSLITTEQIEDVGYIFKGGEKTTISSKTDLSYLL